MIPPLDGRAWFGQAIVNGSLFVVEFFESRKYPGYYHFTNRHTAEDFVSESKRPIVAKKERETGFWCFLQQDMIRHGLKLDDLQWKEIDPQKLHLSLQQD